MLADSHVHLDRYPPVVLDGMLVRARSAKVEHLLTVGVDAESSATASRLAAEHTGLRAAIGVHPRRAGEVDIAATLARLRQLALQPGVVAIGEVGLDVGVDPALASHQEDCFEACLALARELELPLALHVIGAHRRAQEMLVDAGRPPAVVHYFQGDWPLARAYLALGCYISVGKPVTRQERTELRDAVRQIPLDRLLLETDTYPLPGRTTEPADVLAVCRAVAELRGTSWAQVAQATTATFIELLGGRRRAGS